MLHRKLSHSHLSGFSTVLKRYVSNVCILAGTPTLDAQGARLMHSIRESSTEEVNFFGIGGQEMINAGLDDVIGDINKFNTYPFYPLKNMRSYSEYFFFHPQMAYTRYCNKQVYDKMLPSLTARLEDSKPDLFISLGNHLLANKVYTGLNKYYANKGEQKPPTVLVDRWIHRFESWQKETFDHMLYTVPVPIINWEYSEFPNTYVGSQAVFDAWKFLYGTSIRHKNLVDSTGIWINSEFNTLLMENLIIEQRRAVRKSLNIGETVTTMFACPGTTASEAKKFANTIAQGAQRFIAKFEGKQQVSQDNFAMIIAIPEVPEADAIEKIISNTKWACRIEIVRTNKARYEAICASDMGISVNSEVVSECAALQLPTLILEPMDPYTTYMMLLYNNFNNDLSIAAKGEIFPELSGQNFPDKVAEWWEEWQLNPSYKYDYIKRFSKLLPKMLPLATESTSNIAQEGMTFERFGNPSATAAASIGKLISAYRTMGPADTARLSEQREEMLNLVHN